MAGVRAAVPLMLCVLAGCGTSGVRSGPFDYSPFHHNRHNAIVRVRAGAPLVALTFDDGPGGFTRRLLRTLRRERFRATFFDVGEAALRHPELVRAELRSGAEVGNHTLRHARLTALGPRAVAAEVGGGASALRRSGAPAPRLFRPPYGAFDEAVGVAAARAGELMIGWDVAFDRVGCAQDPVRAAATAARLVRPGSIVLLHQEACTLRALPLLITALRDRGLRPVRVGELIARAAGAARTAAPIPRTGRW